MRILLAGAAGFLGEAVAEVLSENHLVRGFDLRESRHAAENVLGSISEFADVYAALDGCEAFVNATMAGHDHYADGAAEAFNCNVRGAYTLFEAARQRGLRLAVHLSSGAVFGPTPEDKYFANDSPQLPKSTYDLTKKLQEEVCLFFARNHGFSVTSFRPWSIIDRERMVSKFDRPASATWGACDRFDLGRAIELALTHPVEGFRAYVIADNEAAREKLDLAPLERDLGWRPKY